MFEKEIIYLFLLKIFILFKAKSINPESEKCLTICDSSIFKFISDGIKIVIENIKGSNKYDICNKRDRKENLDKIVNEQKISQYYYCFAGEMNSYFDCTCRNTPLIKNVLIFIIEIYVFSNMCF